MSRYLVSEENPEGMKLEEILTAIRKEILMRCTKIVDDDRSEAQQVFRNNTRILELLGDAIDLAVDSTQTLDKAFGPSQAAKGGPPRIGNP